MTPRLRLAAPLFLTTTLFLSAVLASCASIPLSRSYLGNSTYGTSVIAPGDWKGFAADAVLAGSPGAAPGYIEAFGPQGVDPTRPMFGDVPGGILIVNLYPGLDAGRTAARNALITDLDAAIAAGHVTVLAESGPTVEGVWERRSLLLEVRPDAPASRDSAAPSGTVMRVMQETMLATRPTGKDADGMDLFPLKTLVLGCSTACFATHEAVLQDVKDSWRVE